MDLSVWLMMSLWLYLCNAENVEMKLLQARCFAISLMKGMEIKAIPLPGIHFTGPFNWHVLFLLTYETNIQICSALMWKPLCRTSKRTLVRLCSTLQFK